MSPSEMKGSNKRFKHNARAGMATIIYDCRTNYSNEKHKVQRYVNLHMTKKMLERDIISCRLEKASIKYRSIVFF